MPKYDSKDKECCFEEMSKGPSGQSMPPVYDEVPMINEYEKKEKRFMGDKGFDWSGMEKGKK